MQTEISCKQIERFFTAHYNGQNDSSNLDDILLAVPVTAFASELIKLEIFIFSPPMLGLGISLEILLTGMVDVKPIPPILALLVTFVLILPKLFALDNDNGPRVVLL